jgi:tetratricopeptide (TPR) repeat protein
MTTRRHHTDTESRPTGLDGRIQDLADWIGEHRKQVAIGLGALVGAWVLLAVSWEISRTRRAEASAELAAIEAAYASEMGAQPGVVLVEEPANPEQAKRAREAAIAKLDAFAADHGGHLGHDARLRAAEFEVDLERFDAADARLAALVAELGGDDARKGIALRLQGFAREQLGRDAEAAALYEQGGALEDYPPRALLWIAAARTHQRLGAHQNALRALDQAIDAEPELATDPVFARERRMLQAAVSAEPAPAPPPAATPPAPNP